ncbi:3-phosphoshikimate 1-carboxyvinyltransferase [Rubripirellula amarantea]|uniref:3-phosphoshikimate 1-carboxyvinyltransferase n=1 Tax=Rubripirellula amarantea TaxID=2527999 RepID=UPI0011B5F8DE|nr:3-phosphoshikimate 1-carboxyvinyltransferase [Rubripirellula amarantea]
MNDSSSTNHASPAVTVIPGGPVHGTIRPPGSKSLTNRALICAAMAEGASKLTGALSSEDTEVMIEALRAIGVEINVTDGGQTLLVDPAMRARCDDEIAELFIANSGTSIRFLTAALSAFGGRYRLVGVPRMHARPIGDLVSAISEVIDGTINAESTGGCPPVMIESHGWSGSSMSVAGNVSSQFLSGLMMAAPLSLGSQNVAPIELHVTGELVSRPYIDMTADVMESFGGRVVLDDLSSQGKVVIERRPYQGTDYSIEPDASAASYFWAIAAITGGEVTVEGLSPSAMQGDVGFVDVLEKMGCVVKRRSDSITVLGQPLHGVDIDMNSISDTVQTLAVVALFATGPTRVRGVAHNRFKETDRIGDLACELRKLGALVEEHSDGLTITPASDWRSHAGATLETYHDHRMAMSLSLAGLKMRNVKILDPACTSKTYPEFFHDLETLIGRSHHWAA